MDNIREMVEALGGSRRVGSDLGVSQQAVCNMVARNRMHPKYWRTMIKWAKTHGVQGINLNALLDIAEDSDGD